MTSIQKATLRIPCSEQYAYLEVELKGEPFLTKENIIERYHEFIQAIKPQEGLTDKEFNACIDRYLLINTMDSECYDKMSVEQKNIVQTLKRAFKRIKANATEELPND